MRYWDSSAVVATLVAEPASPVVEALARADGEATVWALTPVEILSALARRERAGEIDATARGAAERDLAALERGWRLVTALTDVGQLARSLVTRHLLRAGDAIQLAAALIACAGDPAKLPLVTLDDRLAAAARAEGFAVLP